MKDKSARRVILLSALFLILIVSITFILWPYITQLSDPDFQDRFKVWVANMGVVGLLVVFGIQTLQIVIAFIPGEPVEIIAGVLYGSIGGTLVCLLGCIFASSIIFSVSKRFGKRLLYRLFREEKVKGWRWLQDGKKVDTATFMLFLVPGTPKDMLTYVVGVSKMKLGKFLSISTVARIPSILSSAMVGSTLRQGEWEISIIVFALTGIAGVLGIRYKDRMVNFCRRIIGRDKTFIKSQCLDFVETSHREIIYPLITCRMNYDGQLDVKQMLDAVQKSSIIIPEILYVYDYGRGGFVDTGLTAENVVQVGVDRFEEGWKWDVGKSTQLKILVNNGELIIGVSHILCDGKGFLQYLYLLASLYNGAEPDRALINQRDILSLLTGNAVGPATEQEKYNKAAPALSLRAEHKAVTYYCLTSQISAENMAVIHRKAKDRGVTLNDVFLTAYARVLAGLLQTDTIVLPCPADLRQFYNERKLTVANMTGMFKIAVEGVLSHTFDAALAQVSLEVHLQKERRRCFAGIRALRLINNKLPSYLINRILKKGYSIFPISYTNIGEIDNQHLTFNNITITNCFVTGTYRYPPDFQIAISTFKGVCSLNCTLLGDNERMKQGQQILDLVKRELLVWGL